MEDVRNTHSGFSLLELLVVIAIIGMLATIVMLGIGTTRQKARDAKRFADIAQLQRALSLYSTGTGEYPASEDGSCANGVDDPLSAALMDRELMSHVPRDPLTPETAPGDGQHCYFYTSHGGSSYTLQFYQERASDRGSVGTVTVRP